MDGMRLVPITSNSDCAMAPSNSISANALSASGGFSLSSYSLSIEGTAMGYLQRVAGELIVSSN